MTPGVQLRGVSAGYDGVEVLHGVDLTVRSGTLTAVLGASGCGKSTLLRVVAGFLRPSAGEVEVAGRTVAGPGRHVAPERRRVGIVPQEGALFPHLDVAGNIGFGLPRRGRAARVAELLDIIGLPAMERARPHELSGGMAQRVALARALAPAPDVVLLDEPFSALDVSLRASVRAEVITALKACDATAVLVTHDQDEALSIADEVAVLRAGSIVQVAAPRQIYEHPVDRDLAVFLGDCNLLAADRTPAGTLTCILGELPATVPFDAGAGVAMLRPEHIDARPGTGASATVAQLSYHGHDVLLDITLANGSNVKSRMLAGVDTPAPGDRVNLHVIGV
ncbi:MAG: ABC transporter ATP-binding protein [Actinobacteria bacterium]|nr:ABC transporter ATP-binding protein [Actinomycetota bacterium]MCB9411716.1 ABC transporter ATP-binding protein [Actinomycetota bacterium]